MHGTLYSFMWRQRDRDVIPFVTNRDLRRTWKTLAGKAGVSKEIRDRIQNHALQDVSSKNYDRWTYMPEKRAGMEHWNEFVTSLLRKTPMTIAAKFLVPFFAAFAPASAASGWLIGRAPWNDFARYLSLMLVVANSTSSEVLRFVSIGVLSILLNQTIEVSPRFRGTILSVSRA